jgi:hypothetical protein
MRIMIYIFNTDVVVFFWRCPPFGYARNLEGAGRYGLLGCVKVPLVEEWLFFDCVEADVLQWSPLLSFI